MCKAGKGAWRRYTTRNESTNSRSSLAAAPWAATAGAHLGLPGSQLAVSLLHVSPQRRSLRLQLLQLRGGRRQGLPALGCNSRAAQQDGMTPPACVKQ